MIFWRQILSPSILLLLTSLSHNLNSQTTAVKEDLKVQLVDWFTGKPLTDNDIKASVAYVSADGKIDKALGDTEDGIFYMEPSKENGDSYTISVFEALG